LGRLLYEARLYWETANQDPSLDELVEQVGIGAGTWLEFAGLWMPLPKVGFSRTLSALQGTARLASGGPAEQIERLRAAPEEGDIAIGGATLAAEAPAHRLIDALASDRECPRQDARRQEELAMNSMARRMFELVEPIGVIPYSADEPNEAMFALGFTNYWDTYFAGRAAPLGLAPAEVVDALFYNFAPGEVARHIPKVWRTTTPEAAIAARQMGCGKALRRILGDRIDSPAFARAADLLTKAGTSAPLEGRPMYAALRALPIPDDAVARLFHAASLLREHRGDGHIAALMIEGVGGLEAHVLVALDMDLPAEKFGRIHHLPAAQLAAVIDGMRDRGLIGDDGWLSELGHAVKQRVEALTDDLAAKPYESLEPDELDELMAALEPLATLLLAAQD